MRAWLLCGILGALGCGPTSPARRAAPALPLQTAQPRAAASPPTATLRAPTRLEKSFTGQPQPTLVVSNGFLVAQHVFIDWEERATLTPASSREFELAVGTHTVICADSADPDNNPVAITETFETGYAYAYAIRPTP